MPEWVMKVAQALKDEWMIGTSSRFCDEVDFDSATVEEVAKLIWREYQAAQQIVQADAPMWRCKACGAENSHQFANCVHCGRSGRR